MTDGYAGRRFNFDERELSAFRPYLYAVLGARGSGEHALRHLLRPFAWPVEPLEGRLPALQRVPVTFIYGERDWTDPRNGQRVCDSLRALRQPLNDSDARVFLVEAAGHFPMLEEHKRFVDVLLEAAAPHMAVVPPHGELHAARSDELPELPDEPPTAEAVVTDL